MPSGAYPLEMGALNPRWIVGTNFSIPHDNGIRALSPEYLTVPITPPYYGDTVNIQFWQMLGIPFGSSSTTDPPYTRQDGYTYVFDKSRETFEITDNFNARVVLKTGITTLSDLNIDFTIMNSHQFIILVSPDDLGGQRFLFPAMNKHDVLGAYEEELEIIMPDRTDKFWYSRPIYNDVPIYEWQFLYSVFAQTAIDVNMHIPDTEGVLNFDNADRVRPYLPTDLDNPIWYGFKHLWDFDLFKFIYGSFGDITKGYAYEMPEYEGLNKATLPNWEKNFPTNYFYWESFDLVEVLKVCTILQLTYIPWDVVLPSLSTSMFPRLRPMINQNETNNGRPLYEPWKIYSTEWGDWLEMFFPKHTEDEEDEYYFDVFDLSPMWN